MTQIELRFYESMIASAKRMAESMEKMAKAMNEMNERMNADTITICTECQEIECDEDCPSRTNRITNLKPRK